MSLTSDIKDFALDLGYSGAGITSAAGFPDYAAELRKRNEMYRFYTESTLRPLDWTEPQKMMPSARSIIAVVLDCAREAVPEKFAGKIGRIYLARAYITPRARINGMRRQMMKEFLEKNGMEVTVARSVPERQAAARAGIATYGKNTFVYFDGMGSFGLVTTFVVNAELEYDSPTMTVNCPPNCTACIDACPTGALYEPLRMDPRRCIAYNCFTTIDGNPGGVTSYIPPDIREKMGSWIHGCDVCQTACPRNQKRLKMKLPPGAYLERKAHEFDLVRVLNMTDEYYRQSIQPLTYNYITEKKYLQRNAAIALGNTCDSAFIPDLSRAMSDPAPLVRGYAAWALGRIGGKAAKQTLEDSLGRETEESVRREIKSALAGT
ncbi:MAG: HEAT repeat domain-containing protein [Dehalococcoidales bacterium]|nr:HEAT repeat domain-containing protein [Dehalococcoidales bacterium]